MDRQDSVEPEYEFEEEELNFDELEMNFEEEMDFDEDELNFNELEEDDDLDDLNYDMRDSEQSNHDDLCEGQTHRSLPSDWQDFDYG